jgi:hypothetical protein
MGLNLNPTSTFIMLDKYYYLSNSWLLHKMGMVSNIYFLELMGQLKGHGL